MGIYVLNDTPYKSTVGQKSIRIMRERTDDTREMLKTINNESNNRLLLQHHRQRDHLVRDPLQTRASQASSPQREQKKS